MLLGSYIPPKAQSLLIKLYKAESVTSSDFTNLQQVVNLKNKHLKGMYGSFEEVSQEDGLNTLPAGTVATYFGIGAGNNGSEPGKRNHNKALSSYHSGIYQRVVNNHLAQGYRRSGQSHHYRSVYGDAQQETDEQSALPLYSLHVYFVFAEFPSTGIPLALQQLSEALIIIMAHSCHSASVTKHSPAPCQLQILLDSTPAAVSKLLKWTVNLISAIPFNKLIVADAQRFGNAWQLLRRLILKSTLTIEEPYVRKKHNIVLLY
jgi:hypothetical protein